MIKEGTKTTTLRSLKYGSYPYPKRKILIPNDLTNEIIKQEGYETKEQLIKELKSMRHKLPKEMWLYNLKSNHAGCNHCREVGLPSS